VLDRYQASAVDIPAMMLVQWMPHILQRRPDLINCGVRESVVDVLTLGGGLGQTRHHTVAVSAQGCTHITLALHITVSSSRITRL
jgi:hypothetical protein